MAKLSKRALIIWLVVVLAVVGFAAPAYAYFTAMVSATGEKEISLEYSGDIHEEIVDGVKQIQIKNTGENDIMARAQIFCVAPEGVNVRISGEGWVGQPYSAGNESGFIWEYKGGDEGIIHPGDASATLYIEADASGVAEDILQKSFDITVVGQYSPIAYDEDGHPHAYLWDKVQ